MTTLTLGKSKLLGADDLGNTGCRRSKEQRSGQTNNVSTCGWKLQAEGDLHLEAV